MASKTSTQVQGDFYEMLRDSDLAKGLSGEVYRDGFRPRDSRLEDAVVVFTAGAVEEIESGVVTINIFCPDIDPYANGVTVADGARLGEIEMASAQWVETLTAAKSDYLIRLKETIHTTADEEIRQHFVVIKLSYRYFSRT